MGQTAEQLIFGVIAAVVLLVAMLLGYLLARHEPGVRNTRVGVFVERDRGPGVHTGAESGVRTNPADVDTAEWPLQS